jgi:hypothetical protein
MTEDAIGEIAVRKAIKRLRVGPGVTLHVLKTGRPEEFGFRRRADLDHPIVRDVQTWQMPDGMLCGHDVKTDELVLVRRTVANTPSKRHRG